MILLTMLIATTALGNQLHERMTEEEIQRVFRVGSRDIVPDYETVHLQHMWKRSAKGERRLGVDAFGKRFQLHLKQNRDFENGLARLKVFSAQTTPNGLHYEPMQDEGEDIGKPYHDHSNMAALVIREDKRGSLQVEGTLGHDLAITPIPKNLRQETYYDADANDDEMFLDEEYNSTLSHIVYKRPQSLATETTDYDVLERSGNKTHRIHKRAAPDTVWPEVLLIVDYDTYLLHGRSHSDIKRYFVSFWNGVDLRYRLLSGPPKVKISLAGMIVAKDRDATPYLERNRLRSPNEDAVDVAGALTDMGKYLFREDRLPTYDLAVVITKLDMCRRHTSGGRCNRGTAGFAYVGGACVVNKRLEKVNSVAIIEDSGGFSGIIVAAHEVGHLLGCVHDGSPPPSYLGGPGATNCPWEDGFIMSDLRHTERGFRWSSCSVRQFRHFLLGETATCLYNYPHENQLLARVLPGTMMSLDEQCRRDRGTTSCFKDSRVCAQLFCYDSSSGYCVSYRPAAEGSPCGDGQTCKNGRCIAEIENIIPDYTHVTASFATETRRRSDTVKEVTFSPMATTSRPSSKECTDSTDLIAGRMSCSDFLRQFGNRYCSHEYIQRNCCYSQSVYCA
ncbi:A disintegrin and metalloproteinase with thrombospondin motifs like isoform X2 [Ornithodoros turicata]